jgi:hypothetical protein
MSAEQTKKRRTERSPRRTFSIREQLLGKLGPDKFSALEGRLAARTRPPRKRGRGRRS